MTMHLSDPVLQAICRRTFLSQARMGLGSAALWSLLRDESIGGESLPDGGSRGIVQPPLPSWRSVALGNV
jgi:hypothetical protein